MGCLLSYLPMDLRRYFTPGLILASLGYFVDLYDLLLFSSVRESSLLSIGIQRADLIEVGAGLLNTQMIGMLVGGIFWGVLSDKRGRLSTLYGSIILYSVANLANGFVDSVFWYGAWRFLAGIGLAGELGAGITLVAETAPQENRGISTSIVACIGLLGAVLAGAMAPFFEWRHLYFIGGGLGFLLLALRIKAAESGMYAHTTKQNVSKGNILLIFRNWPSTMKYLNCIIAGMPIWLGSGILLTYASEVGRALEIPGILSSTAVACGYGGSVFGDLSSGFLAQWFKNRKKAMLVYMLSSFCLFVIYCSAFHFTALMFYGLLFIMGIAAGYWVLLITMSAEQFGTNIRGTVTTSVPNFIRASLVPMSLLFITLKVDFPIMQAIFYTGLIVYGIGFLAWWGLKDTFHKDLNYHEA